MKEHSRATQSVQYAIKTGKLPPVITCTCAHCGAPAEQYHHHNGYAKEHVLDVIPLCKKCHGAERVRARVAREAAAEIARLEEQRRQGWGEPNVSLSEALAQGWDKKEQVLMSKLRRGQEKHQASVEHMACKLGISVLFYERLLRGEEHIDLRLLRLLAYRFPELYTQIDDFISCPMDAVDPDEQSSDIETVA